MQLWFVQVVSSAFCHRLQTIFIECHAKNNGDNYEKFNNNNKMYQRTKFWHRTYKSNSIHFSTLLPDRKKRSFIWLLWFFFLSVLLVVVVIIFFLQNVVLFALLHYFPLFSISTIRVNYLYSTERMCLYYIPICDSTKKKQGKLWWRTTDEMWFK